MAVTQNQPWINTQKMTFTPDGGSTYTMIHNPRAYSHLAETAAAIDVPAQVGEGILNGGSEYAPIAVPLQWDEMDLSEFQFLASINLQPCTMIDMVDNGYYGYLKLAEYTYLPGVATKVGAVKAAFMATRPANGQSSVINTLPSINVYLNSDSLSGSTLSGLTLASGGPSGATDAEYTGTGSAVGSLLYASRKTSVTMGQTYVGSWWVDPSQITNNNGAQFQFGFNTADNLQSILVQNLPSTATTAGRYATSPWTCPTNLVAHSDDFGNWDKTYANTGTIVSNAFSVPGTGAALNAFIISPFISVSQNQVVALSAGINASQCSSSAPLWAIYDVTGQTQGSGNLGAQLFTLPQTLGASNRISGSYTIPAGVTQIAVVPFTNNCVVPNGQTVTFSQAMLNTAGATYYISSQNPQIEVFAQLLSSAIVANGQKFKLSQPMLTTTGASTPYVAGPAVTVQSGGSIPSNTTIYYALTDWTPWGESTMMTFSVNTGGTNNASVLIQWNASTSTNFRKRRVYASSSPISPGTLQYVMADVIWSQTPQWTDTTGTNGLKNQATTPSINHAFTGSFGGGVWNNGT